MSAWSRRLVSPVVRGGRAALAQVASRARGRAVLQSVDAEIRRALSDTADAIDRLEDVYADRYFGEGRDALDRMGLSGYERYDRQTSNADIAAYVLWKHLSFTRSLDVGCAMGFVVEALRELDVDADGIDVSRYAIEHAALGARGHLSYGNLVRGTRFRPHMFDLVTAFEVLEHLPPESIPQAIAELRRLCGRWLVATIPSFGPNPYGPDGWLQAKVSDEVIADYLAKGPDYDGPVAFEDLWRDVNGDPIEGHLTIASFRWWTARFTDAGFVRCGEVEQRMHVDIRRFGLSDYWNLYVFRTPDATVPETAARTEAQIAEVEARWLLEGRNARPANAPDPT